MKLDYETTTDSVSCTISLIGKKRILGPGRSGSLIHDVLSEVKERPTFLQTPPLSANHAARSS